MRVAVPLAVLLFALPSIVPVVDAGPLEARSTTDLAGPTLVLVGAEATFRARSWMEYTVHTESATTPNAAGDLRLFVDGRETARANATLGTAHFQHRFGTRGDHTVQVHTVGRFPSASHVLTVRAAVAPSPPTDVVATLPSGEPAVSLSWSPPLDDGGTPVTGYRVDRRVGAGAWTGLANLAAAQLSFVDRTAPLESAPSYRVLAFNTLRAGAPALAAVEGVPAAPTGEGLAGRGTLTVSWTAKAGSGVQGWRVMHNGPRVNVTVDLPHNATTSYVAEGLVAGSHHVSLRALNVAGASAPTNLTIELLPPRAPTALDVVPAADRYGWNLTWAAPDPDDRAYDAWRVTHLSAKPTTVQTLPADQTSLLDVVGAPGPHLFRVQAMSGDAAGDAAEFSIEVPPPDAPAAFVVNVTKDGVALTWEPTGTGGPHQVTRFPCSGHPDESPSATRLFDGRSGAGERTYCVEAAGVGGEARTAQVDVPLATPGAPRDLRVVATEPKIVFEWDPPLSDGGAPLRSYRIYMRDYYWQLVGVVPATTTTWSDPNVYNAKYAYCVKAEHFVGEGASSNLVQPAGGKPIGGC